MIDITREQFHAFVNKEEHNPGAITNATHHYLTYFDTYHGTGKKNNWNWTALFLGPWWFYRKMYAYGFLVAFLFLLLELLLSLALGPWGLVIGWLFSRIFSALYGDYLYLHHASKKIAKGINTSGVNIWTAGLMGWLRFIGFLLALGMAVTTQGNLSKADMLKAFAEVKATANKIDDPISD